MTEEGGLDAAVLSLITEAGGAGPVDSDSETDSEETTPGRTAAAARDKARRRTVNTQDLLFANGAGAGPDGRTAADGERPTLLPLSRSHSHVLSSNSSPRWVIRRETGPWRALTAGEGEIGASGKD